MTRAAIGLGSNLGDRLENLRRAVTLLGRSLEVVAISSLYETAPMYIEEQPTFLNGALLVNTELGPLDLLKLLKATEREIGRSDAPRFGPREIDLDLLSYGVSRYVFNKQGEDVLVLPHPRIPERLFVLRPLMDMDPDLELPGIGKVRDLIQSTEVQSQSVLETSHALLPVLRH